MKHKYPIGTKVIFTAKPTYDRNAIKDSGKIAIVTACKGGNNHVSIFIPDSKNNEYTSGRNPKVTWTVPFEDIKLFANQQLQFDFMY